MTHKPIDNSVGLPRLGKRAVDSHKGDFGRALLIGGSRGMSGAITLAGRAALRSGAGLVKLAVPQSIQDIVAGGEPSYMTTGLAEDDAGRLDGSACDPLIRLTQDATALAIGPGMDRAAGVTELVCRCYQQVALPMVVDADALNALAERPNTLAHGGGPRVLVPHLGEFRRLLGSQAASRTSRDELVQLAIQLATDCQVVLVLKGHQTLITNGTKSFFNDGGNPGMATGGAGDVLTGVTAALLCQGMSALDAARLAVYVHATAGDLAADQLGEVSLIASDLVEYLPGAFMSLAIK